MNGSEQNANICIYWIKFQYKLTLRAYVGYRRPRHRSDQPGVIAPNRLQRAFNADTPNETWVTDINYIRIHEGWL